MPNLPSFPLVALILNQGPFPPPALPGFIGTTGLSATLPRPACPSRVSGWPHARPRDRVSRVAATFLFHTCRHQYPGGITGCTFRSLHLRQRPSLYFRQVGFRITLFEACSVFTHITACMFAKSLSEPSTPEASAASLPPRLLQLLPVGTKITGRDSHPLENSAFSRRTLNPG